MKDIASQAKEKVLQQIMDLMDERELGSMKGRSPKFAKVDIQSDDPALAEKLKTKMMSSDEDMNEDPSKEMSPEDIKEDKAEGEDPFAEKDSSMMGKDHADMSDDDLERLKELYAKLK
jgi:hypothetical protein